MRRGAQEIYLVLRDVLKDRDEYLNYYRNGKGGGGRIKMQDTQVLESTR